MYSVVEDYLARWLGVTVFTALAMAVIAVFLLKLEMDAWRIAALVGLSIAMGTLHVVLFASKRRAVGRKKSSNVRGDESL